MQILLHGGQSQKDYFELDGLTYLALPLDDNFPRKGMGINSCVFRALRIQDDEFFVVKVCTVGDIPTSAQQRRRAARFAREIRAYEQLAGAAEEQWVLDVVATGTIGIGKPRYACLLLERAEQTLDEMLELSEIALPQRLVLCLDIARAFRALHAVGIYHRDIKPENLFVVDGTIKIGDLGLVAFRGEDEGIDEPRERIGPMWWMSPEAVNKYMALSRSDASFIERSVAAPSDCYQLGKLFWFILQGDMPNGVLRSRDLRVAGEDVFGNVLKPLLNYRCADRITLEDVFARLSLLVRKYAGG